MPVMPRQRVTFTFRNAVLIWKNFGGEKTKYSNKGERFFSILLDEEQATILANDVNRWGNGWSVKPKKMREDDDEQLYTLKVSVKFDNNPPACWLISSTGKMKLPEDLLGMLDKLQSAKIDLTINAYDWEVNGNTGRKAYLENIFFHMYENELDAEYRTVPEISMGGMPLELEAAEEANQRPGDYIDAEYEEVG